MPQSEREEIVVFITTRDDDEAATLARALVQERLAACVNIVRNVRSIYLWQGKLEDDSEVLMIVKTQHKLFESLYAKVKELHSYDLPEVIGIPITTGSEDYLRWIQDSTG
jgi:periplasmic divalent cation tolerance protein